ncbi:hypothetical protein YC2023_066507 [Brassica napus]
MDEGLRKGRYEKKQVKTRELDRSHLSASPMGEDNHHQGHLAHGRGRPAPRSPRPWARQPSPRSPRPWARTTSTTVTSPMGEDDHHQGHLVHGRGRPAPWSPRPWARTTSTAVMSPTGEDDLCPVHLALGEDNPIPASPTRFDSHTISLNHSPRQSSSAIGAWSSGHVVISSIMVQLYEEMI